MDILNIPDIYDFDIFYNYENNKKDNFIMDIENEYNDYVKKFIFIANNTKIYSCKCIFYSGNIIDINLSEHIIVIDDIVYINTVSLIMDGIDCFSQLIKYNNNDDYNIFKLYDDSTNSLRYFKELRNKTYDIINKNKLHLGETFLFVEPNNNIDDIICELIFIKNIQYISISYDNLSINYDGLLYTNEYIGFNQYLINVIEYIEIKNIFNKTGYICVRSDEIIGCIDRVINKVRKRYYKIEDITYEYYYDIQNKNLYLLLKKCGIYTFNEHIKCKTCINLRKSININFNIKILENLILCIYHNNNYENKMKKCFNNIKILKNIILEQIN